MNIAGASLDCVTGAPKGNLTNAMPPGAAAKEVPVEFYDHLSVFMAPHISEDRQSCIAKAAYYRAEQRHFAPGHELDDWLAAEDEFDQRAAGEGCVY